ncbi:MAG: glycosyl hydrolase 108 family protein [Desulfobulbus oligotrophicus]|jgi:lysozyme family protein|nr:glycosyl hydrolase 108 family protein [Desulfobulbus oligotrophicus]
MQENFARSLHNVLLHEGGFTDHPRDPGGATMKGVTLLTFRRFFGAEKTVSDLQHITEEQLAHIYRTGYWDKCSCDALPRGVDYAVFDFAVNSGPGRAVKTLQSVVNTDQDGVIGPVTLETITSQDPATIITALCDRRLSFLKGLPAFDTFGRGWSRRVAEVRQTALAMAGDDPESDEKVDKTEQIPAQADYDTVRRGDKGPWVVKLQKALGLRADGRFGPKTEATLRDFQKENGLEADGIAGRLTYRALGLID